MPGHAFALGVLWRSLSPCVSLMSPPSGKKKWPTRPSSSGEEQLSTYLLFLEGELLGDALAVPLRWHSLRSSRAWPLYGFNNVNGVDVDAGGIF